MQRQLTDGLSVTAGYYRRWFGNFRVSDNTRVVPEDYSHYCITEPTDARLGSVSGTQLCGLYDVSVAKFGQSQSHTTAASNFGKQTEVYDGIDVTTNIRMQRVTLSGGVSTGRVATNNCFVVDSPEDLRFCEVTPPFQPNIKFNGLYTLPWWDLQTSFIWQNIPGPQILATYTARNAEIVPTLGRNLAQGVNGNASIDLIEPGTLYGDRVNTVDFGLIKNVRIGRYRLQGTLRVFNLFNSSDILLYNNNYGTAISNASWRQATRVLQGRYLQLTAQINF